MIEGGKDFAHSGTVSAEVKNRFLQRTMPSQMRRALLAHEIAQTGEVRSPYTGKLIYRPEDRSRTAKRTLIGAPEVRLSQERAMDAIASEAIDRFKRLNSSFAKEAAMAILRGERGRVPQIKRDALEAGIILSDKSINFHLKDLQRPAAERRRRRTPRALRSTLDELYDATGEVSLERL